MNLEKEIWKDVVGFEGLYKVSNLGRVKSLQRTCIGKNGVVVVTNERIKNVHDNRYGYLALPLYKNNKVYNRYVHRLVCEAFLSNPNNHPCVNHKDEDKWNNRVDNLEWCTYKYNSTYGSARERQKKTYRKNHKMMKTVYQYTLNGAFVAEYIGLREAERQTGCKSIHQNLMGLYKQAGGYRWSYVKL